MTRAVVGECGCWVDEYGYERRSKECCEFERQLWAKMLEMIREPEARVHFNEAPTWQQRAHIYFRQELHGDVE